MTTEITTRAAKGAPLTYLELDENFENLKETADAAFDATIGLGGKANASAVGVSASATNMGVFTGSTIPDGQTAKEALQAVETALESKAPLSDPAFTGTVTIDGSVVERRSSRGIADGYAPLGPDNKVPSAYLPDNGSYKGNWDATTNTPTITAGVGTNGDTYTVSIAGTQSVTGSPVAFGVGDSLRFTTNGDKWERIPNTQLVSSVAGKTGTVVLVKADVGLGSVDNTADASKPVSTATATALAGKQGTIVATTTADYYRGDKTFQALNVSAVAGLGTVATQNTGTSGANVPLLSTANTWTTTQTIGGDLAVSRGGGAAEARVNMISDAGQYARHRYYSGLTAATAGFRWAVGKTSDAEIGSNAGSNFRFDRFDDTGTLLGTAMSISRATGTVTLSTPLPVASGGTGGTTEKANASALGVTGSAADMGTFTGAIIPDNQTGKQAMQALETATEAKVDINLGNGDFKYPAATAAVSFPFLNLRTQRRNLGDFIDKAQWANCRAGTPTVAATNGLGQDSLAAAIADMAGSVGGEVEVPDGYFRVAPQTISQSNFTLYGNGRSSVIQSTSATAHHITVAATFCTISGVDFVSTLTRTAGAYVRVLLAGQRFDCEDMNSFGAFTLLQIEGDPTDPAVQGGVYNARKLRAESSVINGAPFVINGGYLVNMDNISQIGNPAVAAINGPAAGLKVTRCADLRVGGNSQFLNCQRSLDVSPGTGATVASLRLEGGFYGTSHYGSRVTGASGGSIVSFQANGSWFGENLDSGGGAPGVGAGLSLLGAAAGRLQQATLMACEFPLAQADGLTVDQYAQNVQVIGGWADGCGGAGYSFNGTSGFLLMGVRSGKQRFTSLTGNQYPYYISATSDNFRVIANDGRDNVNPATNLAGTGATKIVDNNI